MTTSNNHPAVQLPSEYFATCPIGFEALLSKELCCLGLSPPRETVAGVYFRASLEQLYSVCLWSRLANRVLMPLAQGSVTTAEDLYSLAHALAWEGYFPADGSLIIDFNGTNDDIRNTQFGAQTIKDAIVDRMRVQMGQRPSVEKVNPDIRINARLAKGVAHISIDISGDSLHRRGYRRGQGGAPLKENLAAALLLRSGWLQMLAQSREAHQQIALIDPMCGSGTLLIEAALMATDSAPGLTRAHFGFEKLSFHNADLWQQVLASARQRKLAGLQLALPEFRGYDQNPKVLDRAAENIEAAGLSEVIRLSKKSISTFKKPTHVHIDTGLLICNPPYGERLGEVEALREDYRELGRVAKAELEGWTLAVFTSNAELSREMRLRPKKKYRLYNGPISAELFLFDLLGSESILREDKPLRVGAPSGDSADSVSSQSAVDEPVDAAPSSVLSEGAIMVVNRINKNRKRLSHWIKQEHIECYRVYDADIPEYSAAIDVYSDYFHVQEYQAPKTVSEGKAIQRFNDILRAVVTVFDTDEAHIVTKTRRRNRGKNQYEKQQELSQKKYFSVCEGNAKLIINLWDYLDAGLFLDHRPLRLRIAQEIAGKRFLNLFCYTATATVHAVLGGALASTSVDMSNTYIDWAGKNLALNNIDLNRHALVRADCVEWLRECREGFDIIMLDPPSFSNSKKMDDVLDVQRDHVSLITRCMELLNPGGVVYFSNNLRSFKLDSVALSRYAQLNITEQTLDPDFKQNPKIHRCWEFRAVKVDTVGPCSPSLLNI
ncbi:MAG: 23S rRNA (guanine2445-N2)-methyltransferase / 23S rRNA (guanine2069-N7)-methyltransferase [Lentisphaeria bacterium]|jgi:23S rRNA (guanine2445-N2)-methyltransferase / 23S rRNA (guanine2069-N7)-methyltransferase